MAAVRVVVTGLGLVSPVGCHVPRAWQRICNGPSAVTAIAPPHAPASLRVDDMPSRVAAFVPRGAGSELLFDSMRYVPPREAATLAPHIQFALASAAHALHDAGFLNAISPHPTPISLNNAFSSLSSVSSRRDARSTQKHHHNTHLDDYAAAAAAAAPSSQHVPSSSTSSTHYSARFDSALVAGVSMGTAVGGIDELLAGYDTLRERGVRRVPPRFVPSVLANTPAGEIAIRFGLRGPIFTPATACAAGAHAIGDAFRVVQRGEAVMMVAGGTEACINRLVLAGFCSAKALSTAFNDTPSAASRPFDKQRDGFVMAEGAAALVLEALPHALRRGARIYAELVGFAATADAHHMTAPLIDGSGAARAMAGALRDARMQAEDVDYVNAHATSTPLGDVAEVRAVQAVFAHERQKPLYISSTKGVTGHMLGAAGAAEALFTVLALEHQRVPHTANLQQLGDPADADPTVAGFSRAAAAPLPPWLNFVSGESKSAQLDAAISNSFGFGGMNCSLLFRRSNTSDPDVASM